MIIISMVVRNEAHRHLQRVLDCVAQIDGLLCVTDDASDDDGATVEMLYTAGAELRIVPEPSFWKHEGKFRQAHYDWFTQEFVSEGDWILSLDADETVSHPERLSETVAQAHSAAYGAILMPLYEFWTETEYRTDGYWHGTLASRLYRWRQGGTFRNAEMGCGSEPDYVQSAVKMTQDYHRLLHWGYLFEEDRPRKRQAYLERLGGHGHNMAHVESITANPALKEYQDV